jgi:hypothetical protein
LQQAGFDGRLGLLIHSNIFVEPNDKPRLALTNITAGVREPSEWSGRPSDIEGKTTRVGASECGQRTSFNRTRVAGHIDEIQGVVASTLKLACDGALGSSIG